MGVKFVLSPSQIRNDRPICFKLQLQQMDEAFRRTLIKAGISRQNKMAITAIITDTSIFVKAATCLFARRNFIAQIEF
jgi:hypothetical protein